MNINLHQHHWSKSPAHNTSTCHYVLCSIVRNAFCPIFVFIMPERCIAGDDHTKFNQHAHVLRNSRGQVPSQPRWRGQVFSGAACPICKVSCLFKAHQPNHCILFSWSIYFYNVSDVRQMYKILLLSGLASSSKSRHFSISR